MKTQILTLLLVIGLSSVGSCADTVLPDQPMGKQLEWAETGKSDSDKADRLEAFWKKYLPQEDGGVSPDLIGYGDGSHVCAIIRCAWQLTRAYISTGQKEKALAMVNWLAEHESKTSLAPVIKPAEQAGADQPATQPADKPPVKDQPSTPTSKDGPR